MHEFEAAGASAIHIEDTVFGKHTTRTDALYLNDGIDDAIARIIPI